MKTLNKLNLRLPFRQKFGKILKDWKLRRNQRDEINHEFKDVADVERWMREYTKSKDRAIYHLPN